MNWEDRVTVKKGNVGEDIVDRHMKELGYIPYRPDADGAHPFDRLVASRDKRTVFIADVKAKARRTHYPDTGINQRHFEQYQAISRKHGLHVFLAFVDEIEAAVYGEFLRVLERPHTEKWKGRVLQYPMTQHGIRYWPRSKMRLIGKISEIEQADLMRLSTRNPAYDVRTT